MKLFTTLSLITLVFFQCKSLRGQELLSARGSGLSGISVTLNDLHAAIDNPAQNTSLEETVAGINSARPFNVSDLNTLAASFLLPFNKTHSVAAHVSRVGFSEFYEQKFTLSYGIKLSPKLSLGIAASRSKKNYRLESDRATSAWTSTIGISSVPLKGLQLSSSISNPERSKWNNEHNSSVPSTIRIGTAITVSSKVRIYSQLTKESLQSSSVHLGIEYNPFPQVKFRTGISSNPISPALGASLNWKNTSIDFAINSVPHLGFSPQISIQQKFN
jgi:hypothetical protein